MNIRNKFFNQKVSATDAYDTKREFNSRNYFSKNNNHLPQYTPPQPKSEPRVMSEAEMRDLGIQFPPCGL